MELANAISAGGILMIKRIEVCNKGLDGPVAGPDHQLEEFNTSEHLQDAKGSSGNKMHSMCTMCLPREANWRLRVQGSYWGLITEASSAQ